MSASTRHPTQPLALQRSFPKAAIQSTSPTGSGNHRPDETQADHALTFKLEDLGGLITVAKSFFNLLKCERIRRRTYKTREQARKDIFDYIEIFYNPKRKHLRNDMLSPVDCENG